MAITFDEKSKIFILEMFDYTVNSSGWILDKDKQYAKDIFGKHINILDFGGICKEGLFKDDFYIINENYKKINFNIMKDTLFIVSKGNEFGFECLSDAYVSVAIENAFIKFNEYAEDPDVFGCALYEYDPDNQKFNLIESHYED